MGSPDRGVEASRENAQGQGKGSSSGFAIIAHPVGAFINREGELSRRPAVDVNRIVLGGQVVAVAALLRYGAIVKAPRQGKGSPLVAYRSVPAVTRTDWPSR